MGAPRGRTPQAGPQVLSDLGTGKPSTILETPATLVPFWMEQYRCTTLTERFEFDLDPGVYDIYIAFDLMIATGAGCTVRPTT